MSNESKELAEKDICVLAELLHELKRHAEDGDTDALRNVRLMSSRAIKILVKYLLPRQGWMK